MMCSSGFYMVDFSFGCLETDRVSFSVRTGLRANTLNSKGYATIEHTFPALVGQDGGR